MAQQGATTGQVLRWNGTQWAPSAGGGISEPLNQVVYGTGTGVDSKPQFAINSDTLNLTGNIIVRPSVKSSTQFYPYSIWPQKNLSTDGYMGVLRIPMDSFAYRANSDPLHGNFPSWIQSFSWDNSINVPAGNPVDTTGNLIMNQGFNYDEADPTYNPKFPKFYWSTEMKYRAGTNSKSWVESHWEFVDTLGRVNRPITMAYAYDGSYADVTLTSEYKSYLKGSAQKALTPLIPYWETTDFTTGVSNIYYPLSVNIKKRYSGNIMQAYSNKTGIDSYRNIIRKELNDVVQIGDSAGVRVYNTLYFGQNSSQTKVKSQSTQITFDSMLVEFVSQPSVFRNFKFSAPGSANSGVALFDGSGFYFGKYAGNEGIFGLNINSPNNAFFITSAGKWVYNGSASFADFDFNQRTNNFGGGLRFLNTGGNYTTIRTNGNGYFSITTNSSSTEKNIATTTSTTSPEGIVTAVPGSICMTGSASAGDVYIKETGTGNTGWGKALTKNIYNSNGTFGTFRTGTITDQLTFSKTTDALGGLVPFRLSVGGNDADFQSYVSPANNDNCIS